MHKLFDVEGAGGGGKDGGSSGGASEAPNTLQSTATAKFVDVLCEGPVKGLVNRDKSIILNKVPLLNPDNSTNFKGIGWAFLPGTSDQPSLPGFDDITSEFGVQRQVRADTPVTYATNSSTLTAAIVTLNFPAMTTQDKKNGNMTGNTVTMRIELKNNSNVNNSFVTIFDNVVIAGKNTSPFERSYRIPLDGNGPWLIRVSRLSADIDNDVSQQNKSYFGHVTEIIEHRVSYADTAVIGLTIDAKQFGNSVPERNYEGDWQYVDYPSNYNPTTRVYTGFWDGTFINGYCNNPAWVFRYIAKHPRWGANIDTSLIDKWYLYDLAQYCDQMVPDGFGGTEPRFVFNGYVNNQIEAYKVLQQIASMMHAIVFYGAGAVLIRQDKPLTPQHNVYTLANIKGDFSYGGTALKVRHNAAVIQYIDPVIGYDANFTSYEYPSDIIKYGYKQLQLTAYGATSQGQAYRHGKWAILTEQYQTDTVSFTTGFDSADVLPGDIVEIADPHWSTADFGGRIRQPTGLNLIPAGGCRVASWTTQNTVIDTGRAPGPWGPNNLVHMTSAVGTSGNNLSYTTLPVVSGQTYVYSFFVQADTSNFAVGYIYDLSGAVGGIDFDILNNKVRLKTLNVTGKIDDMGQGLHRCSIVYTATHTGTITAYVGPGRNYGPTINDTTNLSWTGDGTGIYVGAPQFELGTVATAAYPALANANTQVMLDRDLDFATATNPQLHLTLLNGSLDDVANVDNTTRPARRTVNYFSSTVSSYDPETQVITLTTAIPTGGNDGTTALVWIFSKDQVKPRPFKVLSIKETGDKDYQILAAAYSAQKFTDLDSTFYISSTSTGAFQNLPDATICLPPLAITTTYTTILKAGNAFSTISASVTASKDKWLRGYIFSYRKDNDNWTTLPLALENHVDIPDLAAGNYTVRCRAINMFGTTSAELTAGVNLTAVTATGRVLVNAIVSDRGDTTFTGSEARAFWTSNALSHDPRLSSIVGKTTIPTVNVLSTAAVVISVAVPAAPTATLSGTFVAGDEVQVTIGLSLFLVTAVGGDTASTMATKLANLIDPDPRFIASSSGAVVTITFASNATNATTLSAHDDPLFQNYQIIVKNGVTNATLRTAYSITPDYRYSYENNQLDNGGVAIRSIRFDVSVQDITSTFSATTTATLVNPSPTAPVVTAVATIGTLTLTFDPPTDPDYAGIIVYAATANGFTPGPSNLVYKDRGNPSIPLTKGTTWYYVYGFYDQFGIVGISYSSQQSIFIPGIAASDLDTSSPSAPTLVTIPLSSLLTLDPVTKLPVITLSLTWNAVSSSNLGSYDIEFKEAAGSFVGGYTASKDNTTITIPAKANTSYSARIRSVSLLGYRSAWSATAGPTTSTQDNVAPIQPTGLTATAAFNSIFLSWAAPTDTDIDHAEVWENTTNNSATSTRIATPNSISGAAGSYTRSGLPTGALRYYWIKLVDFSNNVSVFSAVASATTVSVSAPDFTSGIRPVEVLGSLPAFGSQGRTVFLTTDNKLYRDTGSAWTTAAPTTDLTGQITNTQLASGAVDTTKFAAGLRPIEIVSSLPAAGTQGRTVVLTTDNKLYRDTGSAWTTAVPTTDLSGQIIGAQVGSGIIDTTKFAAGLRPVEVLGSLPAAGTQGRTVLLTTDNKLYRDTGTVWTSAVPTTDLSGTIATAQIANNAVTAAQIAAATITGTQIAAATIVAGNIVTGTITATQIATGTITAANILANTITATQIAANTLTAGQIAANTITATQIASATITATQIASATITATQIAANAITATQLAANSVTAASILAATITGTQIAATTISAANIVANTITSGQIAANTITAGQIAAATITSTQIAAGTITATNILAGTLTSNLITVNTLTGDRIQAASLTVDKLMVTGGGNVAANQAPAGIFVGVTGTTIGTVQSQANDPITQANTKATQITPGLVSISGGTSLANWRNGTDNTKIEGGVIAANTILANSVQIGLRGIDIQGIQFQANWNGTAFTANSAAATAGTISYIADIGTTTSASIAAFTVAWTAGTLYIYWVKGATTLSSTTVYATANAANNVIMASYSGGTDLIVTYGRTIIDGSYVTTNTITADRIVAGATFAQNLYIGGTTFQLAGANGGAGKGALVIKNAGLTVNLVTLGWINGTTVGFQLQNNAGTVIIDQTTDPTTLQNATIAISGGNITGIGTGNNTTVANSSIAVTSGNITGIGTGNNTPVANSSITVVSGVLTGIGTPSITVDNTTIAITSGNITGIGTGNNTPVANSLISINASGVLSGGSGGTVTLGGIAPGVDANATRNRYAYTATDPGYTEDYAQWADTSGTATIHRTKLGGVWKVNSNYIINTNQIPTDGANLGGTAAWTGVSLRPPNLIALGGAEIINNASIAVTGGNLTGIGTGNNTTVANSSITVAAGVLTGIGTSSITVDNSTISVNASGQLNNGVTTLTPVIDNSKVSISAAGTLTGAGGGTVTLGGIAPGVDANATRNRVAYQATDPGFTEDGAIWADTSATATLHKIRLGGLWKVNSNFINNTNQIPTDGANLGGTAAWTGVSSRPTELTDGRLPIAIDPTGYLLSGLKGSGTTLVSNSDLMSGISGTNLAPNSQFIGGSTAYLGIYDNGGGGHTTFATIADSTAPNSSGYKLRISYDGTGTPGTNPAPGFGGFDQLLLDGVGKSLPGYYSRGTVVYMPIWANIPVGRTITYASNLTGTGSAYDWLTPQAGTGGWYLYIMRVTIGSTGTFNSTGFLYIQGGANSAFFWDVARWDQIDVTSARQTFTGNNLLDSAGGALPDAAIKNSAVTISAAGALNGAGGGAITALAADNLIDGATYGRYALTERAKLGGVQAGADVTLSHIAASVYGQGTLALLGNVTLGTNVNNSSGVSLGDKDVLNAFDDNGMGRIAAPIGGTYSGGSGTTGAIRISTPFAVADGRNTMLKFIVDIYEYTQGNTQTYEISGYTYCGTSVWLNTSVRMIGGSGAARTVRFGRITGSNKFAVWIGDPTTVWQYPQVVVRNLLVGYSANTASVWASGWAVTIDTTAAPGPDATFANPNAGDAIFGVNAVETAGGAVATLGNFKTTLGIAASINLQAATATSADFAVVTGVTKPANNAGTTLHLTGYFDAGGSLPGIQGNYVSYGAGSWQSSVLSTERYIGGCIAEATLSSTSTSMIGITSLASPTSSYTQLDYAIYTTTTYAIYETTAGTTINPFISAVTPAIGDHVAVVANDVNVRYYVNGVLIYTSLVSPQNKKFRLMCSFSGGAYSDLNFTALSSNQWALTGGTGKPSDNAGTSGVLTAIGSYTIVKGNSVQKFGGTHGAEQGGAVGQGLVNSAFVTSSLVVQASTGNLPGGGWQTRLALAVDNTNYTLATTKYFVEAYDGGSGSFTFYLYIDGAGRTGVGVTGLTGNSRLMLAYDGIKIMMIVDGVIKDSAPALANLTLYPKVLDFYNSGDNGEIIKDVLYGPYADNNWTSLGGVGKAEDYATSSDNLVMNGSLSANDNNWLKGNGGPYWVALTAGSPSGGSLVFPTGVVNSAYEANKQTVSPINGATKFYASATTLRGGGVTGGAFLLVAYWYTSDGTTLSTVRGQDNLSIYPPTSATWTAFNFSVVPPTDAAYFRLEVYSTATGSADGCYATNIRFAKTENGADVTMLVAGPTVANFAYDYTGTAKAGQFPRDLNFLMSRANGVDVTAAAAWSFVALNGSATATIGAATGTLNVTALPSLTATLQITGTYQGVSRTTNITLAQVTDPPPVTGGGGSATSASTGSISQTTGNAYSAANTPILTVKTGASATLTCSFPGRFYRTGYGGNDAYGKWQWRVVSGTFADIGAEIMSTVSAAKAGSTEPYNDPGSITVNQTKNTGLSANTTYELQMLLRNDTTTATCNWNGTASVVGS
jgi:predicted phage tail protein